MSTGRHMNSLPVDRVVLDVEKAVMGMTRLTTAGTREQLTDYESVFAVSVFIFASSYKTLCLGCLLLVNPSSL